MSMMTDSSFVIAVGSDHAGFMLKRPLMDELSRLGVQPLDLGCASADRCDYPVYADKVVQAIINGQADRGLLICGSGVGMCIAANRHPGIRAVVAHSAEEAALARAHNDVNVLCLGARFITEAQMQAILKAFLMSCFEGGRHAHRVALLG